MKENQDLTLFDSLDQIISANMKTFGEIDILTDRELKKIYNLAFENLMKNVILIDS